MAAYIELCYPDDGSAADSISVCSTFGKIFGSPQATDTICFEMGHQAVPAYDS